MPPINAFDTCNNASHLTVGGIHNASVGSIINASDSQNVCIIHFPL